VAQHTWTFACVYSSLLYLWLFGVLETAVVLIHRDKLITGAVLTVPYLIMLGLTVIAAVIGCAEWIRRRPSLRSGGVPMPGLVRGLQVAFVIVVGFIAAVVLYGPASAHDARYFPVPLTSCTLGALGGSFTSAPTWWCWPGRSRSWRGITAGPAAPPPDQRRIAPGSRPVTDV
jgi:hypothetical protein